jgi:homocysteine S-methyltransferase
MSGEAYPRAAWPNVGLATMAGSRLAFPHATPEYFAEFAARARALGAKLIGGCCGTTPAQIGAIRAAIDENRTATKVRARGHATQPIAISVSDEEPTTLARMLAAGSSSSLQLDRARWQRRGLSTRAAVAESASLTSST